jgi:hypothetical protein
MAAVRSRVYTEMLIKMGQQGRRSVRIYDITAKKGATMPPLGADSALRHMFASQDRFKTLAHNPAFDCFHSLMEGTSQYVIASVLIVTLVETPVMEELDGAPVPSSSSSSSALEVAAAPPPQSWTYLEKLGRDALNTDIFSATATGPGHKSMSEHGVAVTAQFKAEAVRRGMGKRVIVYGILGVGVEAQITESEAEVKEAIEVRRAADDIVKAASGLLWRAKTENKKGAFSISNAKLIIFTMHPAGAAPSPPRKRGPKMGSKRPRREANGEAEGKGGAAAAEDVEGAAAGADAAPKRLRRAAAGEISYAEVSDEED